MSVKVLRKKEEFDNEVKFKMLRINKYIDDKLKSIWVESTHSDRHQRH